MRSVLIVLLFCFLVGCEKPPPRIEGVNGEYKEIHCYPCMGTGRNVMMKGGPCMWCKATGKRTIWVYYEQTD